MKHCQYIHYSEGLNRGARCFACVFACVKMLPIPLCVSIACVTWRNDAQKKTTLVTQILLFWKVHINPPYSKIYKEQGKHFLCGDLSIIVRIINVQLHVFVCLQLLEAPHEYFCDRPERMLFGFSPACCSSQAHSKSAPQRHTWQTFSWVHACLGNNKWLMNRVLLETGSTIFAAIVSFYKRILVPSD